VQAVTYSVRCDKCKGTYLWELKLNLQSRRFVLFLAFLVDMHTLLVRASMVFQRDDLSIGDVAAIDQIAKLATTCGKLESQVHNFVSSGSWARVSGEQQLFNYACRRRQRPGCAQQRPTVSVQASSGRLIRAGF